MGVGFLLYLDFLFKVKGLQLHTMTIKNPYFYTMKTSKDHSIKFRMFG